MTAPVRSTLRNHFSTAVVALVEVRSSSTTRTAQFEALTRQSVFPKGVGLPGRVWATGKPAWIPDVTKDTNFPRGPIAQAVGLHAAFGFPIRVGEEVLGIIEFFSHEIRQPDEDLLRMFSTVGGQIGQFIERRRAEDSLRRSEERFRLALGSGAVTVFEQDVDLRYLWIYPQDLEFPEGTIGRTDEELLPGSDGIELMALKREVLRTGRGTHRTVRVRLPREVRHYDLLIEPRFDATGSVVGVRGAALNVTKREQAEQALREADRRKDEFLATLAHELRNPLAPICTALEILKLSGVSSPTAERALALTERQVQTLARLVDDLLDVARITRGKVELRRQQVKLTDVIERAIETSRPLIETARHKLTVTLPAETIYLNADPARLSQVVANLLNNAAKYMEPSGTILVRVERQGNDAVIRVRDNGIGIAEEMLPRVFDLFTQIDPSPDRSRGGLGIGLTVVKQLIEMHGGQVEATSEGLGRGSEFIVRLPVLQEVAPETPNDPANAQPLPRVSRRVLVVDDNQDAADSLAELLRLAGHDVQTAYNGTAALELARKHSVEVILLDLGLPGMSGHEVARRVREQAGQRSVMLIALTGWGQPEDRRRTQEAGFDHHLTKPADPVVISKLLAILPNGASATD
ncbi:MAG: ATP-binding protein [Planctomycetia bacterium]|nr:ATP-binding protein [Planctomycetia bacterium]